MRLDSNPLSSHSEYFPLCYATSEWAWKECCFPLQVWIRQSRTPLVMPCYPHTYMCKAAHAVWILQRSLPQGMPVKEKGPFSPWDLCILQLIESERREREDQHLKLTPQFPCGHLGRRWPGPTLSSQGSCAENGSGQVWDRVGGPQGEEAEFRE